jgi:hypothetical protein
MAFILMIGASSLIAQESEVELASEAQNPIADLISVPFQNNTYFNIGPHDRTRNVLNIQPVVPLADGKLIIRTILPVVWQPDISTESDGSTGLGDLTFTAFYVPGSGDVTWGIGPVLAFPTGGCDRGTEKWSVGASGVIVATPSPWVVGMLINNVWSVAGADDRLDVNAMMLQYFINYNFPSFFLTSAPIITANWEADSGQQWTVPFGLGIGKLVRLGKLPANLAAHYYNNVTSPDITGADWELRLQVQFLFPK